MRKVVMVEMESGTSRHFGFKHVIEHQLKRVPLHCIPDKVLVDVPSAMDYLTIFLFFFFFKFQGLSLIH